MGERGLTDDVGEVVELLGDLEEGVARLLVQVGDGDAGGEDAVVGVDERHVGAGLCGEVVELGGCDVCAGHWKRRYFGKCRQALC